MVSKICYGLAICFILSIADRLHAQLLISEFLAENNGTLVDEDGDESDWIEVFNAGLTSVDLDGWYLTDDATELDKWSFPSIQLAGGSYLLVFASGKDRRSPGDELHADFRLDIDGEYLALVRPDGETVEHDYSPEYPKQRIDIAYGVGQGVEVDPYLAADANLRVLIPSNGALGDAWKGGSEPFDDSSWIAGQNGVGYVTSVSGFSVTNYLANIEVSDLSVAFQVLDNPATHLDVFVENAQIIDYQGTSAAGHYGNDNPFPGSNAGDSVDNFVIEAVASVTIPTAGNWTFGVLSDDGFSLDIDGNGQSFHIEHAAPRGAQDTLGVFNVSQPGDFDIRLVMYERGGGSGLEFFAAPGSQGSWNVQDFRLLGNTEAGGLEVRSEDSGGGALSGYSAYVGTDVEAEMLGVNPGAYVRYEFSVPDPDALDSLTLRMRYDDGFVAYLNGVEVARRNAPGATSYDSTATADRPSSAARQSEDIGLTDRIDLLDAGGNVLAFHALNDETDSADFLLYAELAEIRIESAVANYFDEPTPGEPNSAGFLNLVADTQFSVDRGFYDTVQQVVISTLTEGAEIRFTLNGDPPTESSGIVYDGPIDIAETTTLRAAAYKSGYLPTNVDTQTYIFLDDVVRQDYQATLDAGFPASWGGTSPDYGMDPDVIGFTGNDNYGGKYQATIKDDLKAIPTLCISMNIGHLFGSSGIYTNSGSRGVAWERPCSVELIHPDGTRGFQVNSGIRIQGGAFRSHGLTKKHSLRLLFKGIYGPTKLRYPLFGEVGDVAQKFDTVTLRGNSNDGWQWGSAGGQPLYVRDSFGRETVLDMGNVSSHETFVHVYINGFYWGVYNPVERPDASFSAHYFGGDKDDWDAYSNSSVASGSAAAWNQMLSLSNQGLASDADYQAIQGNYPDGTDDPAIENYVDVGNLIDYMISNIYGGNSDWPHKNYWGTRQRGLESTGYKFHMWDAEWSLGMRSNLNTNRTGVDNGIATAYGAMRANAEFRHRFGDRLQQVFFKGGALYVDPASPEWDPANPERNRAAARFARLCDTVERALVAESAQWGDQHASTPYTVDEHWKVERDNLLGSYFPQRSSRVLSHFRGAGLYPSIDAPVFNQHGGFVDDDFVLFATAPIGTVYYTMDGSDPRLPSGDIAASAIEAGSATGFTILRSGDPVRVLVPTSDIGTTWTEPGFDDTAWTAGVSGVGYERSSGYEGLIGVDVEDEMYNQTTSVYMRMEFDLDDAAGFALLSLRMKYDDGFVAYLNGVRVAARNASASPTWDSNASGQNSDSAAVVFETIDITAFASELQNGTNVLAVHGLNVGDDSSDLIFVPELSGSTGGDASGIVLPTGTSNIRTRSKDGSEWSALNEATFVSGGPLLLRVSEIMYHPASALGGDYSAEEFEYVEIQNIGPDPIQLSGVSLAGGVDFDFDESPIEILGPGDFLVVVENIDAFTSRYDTNGVLIAGEYSGRLANNGEGLALIGPIGETIQSFGYSDLWYTETDGIGYSLVIVDSADDLELWSQAIGWRASGELFGSPGREDTDDGIPRGLQRPGDANQDGQLDLSDGIALLIRLFTGGAPPLPCEGDLEDGGNLVVFDSNGDDRVNLSDAVYALAFLFQGGPPPTAGVNCLRTEGCPSVCSF